MFSSSWRRALLMGAGLILALPGLASGQHRNHNNRPSKSFGKDQEVRRVVVPPVKSLPQGFSAQRHHKPYFPTHKNVTASAPGPGVPFNVPDRSISAPTLLRNWETIPQSGTSTYPDFSCAAGLKNIVVATNDGIAWYDLNGNTLATVSWDNFVSHPTGTAFYDPQIVYDAFHARWVLSVGASDFSTFGWVLLMRSNTSDPLGGWQGTYLTYNFDGEPLCFCDYPRLGLNDTTIYVSASVHLMSDNSGFESRFLQIDSALFEDAKADYHSWFYTGYWPDVMTPAVMRSTQSVPGHPTQSLGYVLQGYDGGGSLIDLNQVWYDPTTGKGDILFSKYYSLSKYSAPPNATQPGSGGAIATSDCRIPSATFVNGQLETCIGVAFDPGDGPRAALLPIRFNTLAPASGVFISRWFFLYSPGNDIYCAAGAVNADGDAGYAFNLSSANNAWFPSVFYGQIHSDGSSDSFGLLANGLGSSVEPNGLFGRYSGMALDPFDNKTWWGGGEFATAAGTYSTWIGEMNNKPTTTTVMDDVSGGLTDTVTLTAHVSRGDGGDPSGLQVTFKVDGADAGSGVTDAAGTATTGFTIAAGMSGGGHTISALCERTLNLNRSTGSGTLTVNLIGTTTAAADASGQVGQTVQLKAIVTRSDNGTAVSGVSVTIAVDGTPVGTPTTDATGLASVPYIPGDGAVGLHTITATFGGDATHNSSSGSGTLTVSKSDTSLQVVNQTSIPGMTVKLTGTLTRNSDGSALSGKTVTFSNGAAVIGTGITDASGVATKSYTILSSTPAPATLTITAAFAGDASYNEISSNSTITLRRKTAIISAPVSGNGGATITLRGTLKAGTLAISGATITFKVDGSSIGTGITDNSGSATLSHTLTESAGNHVLTVEFAGDTSNGPATSISYTMTVKGFGTTVVTASMTASPGSSFNLSATLKAGTTLLGGKTISFTIDGASVGTAVTNPAGVATLPQTATESAGTHPIVATFAGDAVYASSTANGTLTVKKVDTKTTPLAAAGKVGATVVLKATVKAGTVAVVGETVTFQIDGITVGTPTLDPTGLAQMNYVVPEGVGASHTFTAIYGGDGTYKGSNGSAALTITAAATKLTGEALVKLPGSTVDLGVKLIRTTDSGAVVGRTVNFYDSTGTTLIGTGTTNGSGRASITVTAPAHLVMVKYVVKFAGDTNYAASSGLASVKGS